MAAELLVDAWPAAGSTESDSDDRPPRHVERIVELAGPRSYTPLEVAAAFERALGRPVTAQAVARGRWEQIFGALGVKNPQPFLTMLDGINEGWLAYERRDAHEPRRGSTTLDEAIAALVAAAAGAV